MFQSGEVVLASFPFTDLSAQKARPAVIVGSARYHIERPDVLLGALSTNLTAAVGSLDYVLADWVAAGLRHPTAFRPVVFTLAPVLIVHRIGRLTARDFDGVRVRLRRALDL